MDTNSQNRDPEQARNEGTAKFVRVAQIVQVLVGAVIGTVSLCDPDVIPSLWGILGWMISIIAIMRILTARRRTTGRDSRQRPFVYRVALSAAAVFSLIALTALLTAINADPQAMGVAEIIAVPLLVLLGVICVASALRK
jgi:hypothetical protein